jgi:hypothetical protein
MFNYNFAGIKGVGPSGLTVQQRTREGFGASERVITDSFRAYASAQEGAGDYLSLLDRRYPNALKRAEAGDPSGFVSALHAGGYFTGDKVAYERAVTGRMQRLLSSPPAAAEPLAQSPPRPVLAQTNAPPAPAPDWTTLERPHEIVPERRVFAPQADPPSLSYAVPLEHLHDALALAALKIANNPDGREG